MNKDILKQIIKECFWDYNVSNEDINNILLNNDSREIKKLFSKILYNSQDKLLALSIFTNMQLKECFSDFKITYNHKYITKHFLVLKSILLHEHTYIESLAWKK